MVHVVRVSKIIASNQALKKGGWKGLHVHAPKLLKKTWIARRIYVCLLVKLQRIHTYNYS